MNPRFSCTGARNRDLRTIHPEPMHEIATCGRFARDHAWNRSLQTSSPYASKSCGTKRGVSSTHPERMSCRTEPRGVCSKQPAQTGCGTEREAYSTAGTSLLERNPDDMTRTEGTGPWAGSTQRLVAIDVGTGPWAGSTQRRVAFAVETEPNTLFHARNSRT